MVKLPEKTIRAAQAADHDDSWQRLKIGGAGLGGVLLVAAVTTVVFSNTADEESIDPLVAEQQGEGEGAAGDLAAEAPSEPLVDIGVVPDITPEQSLGDPDEALPEDGVPDLPAPGQGGGNAAPSEPE